MRKGFDAALQPHGGCWTNEGVIGTIILGIVGTVVGGSLASALFHTVDVSGLNVESIVIAVLEAILVLFVYRAVNKRQAA